MDCAPMLILAEGTIHHPVVGDELLAVQMWFGAMADGGFLESGYVDLPRNRLFLFLSSPDLTAADQRLGDLPVVRAGSVSFTTRPVTALRLS
jgi:hypothetical protein